MNSIMTSSILKDLMQRRGISGKDMAKKLGVRVETVSRHVNGRTNMSVEDATKYAQILDVQPEQILFPEHEIPILGEIGKEHIVSPYPIPKMLTGPSPYPSWVVGYHYGKNLGWVSRRVVLIDRKYMERYTSTGLPQISSKCRDQISIVSIKPYNTIKVSVVFADHTTKDLANSNFEEKKWFLRDPYNPIFTKTEPVELNWAAPVCAVIHIPSLFDMRVV
ncbi:putative regulatory protein [uncultured Mediterranean phage uvMED]|nr:putative regulatory protein [uncultured Mediterranean phage uvMED]